MSVAAERFTSNSIAGSPPEKPRIASSSKPGRTVPMSPSVTFSPPGSETISMRDNPPRSSISDRVRNVRSTAPSTLPAGLLRLLAATARLTSLMVSPRRRSSRSGMRTTISSSRRPVSSTRSMPRSTRSSRTRFAQSRSTRSGASPTTASVATASYQTERVTVGRSAPSGRLETCATAVSSSRTASPMSVPSAKVRLTEPEPSRA